MRYEPVWTGIRAMMKTSPGIKNVMRESASKTLRIAQSRVPVRTRELLLSGRVEDLGIQGVVKGEPRMTMAVVFHSRYAMDIEMRTGFLSGSVGRYR